ncbi:hypothetical protein BH93_22775 [Rhodococcoides fascians A25f]|uniref:hypothetical protein n=1 Tax=Rhodococcoides fascians TaxID=1828 RepID=UPI00056D60D4|nr:hypothetical protein [Rhodococcus fascians]QII07822.1 hypothetical protein BH93_22775 [Rhodococcus fascians A25f]
MSDTALLQLFSARFGLALLFSLTMMSGLSSTGHLGEGFEPIPLGAQWEGQRQQQLSGSASAWVADTNRYSYSIASNYWTTM